MRGVWLFLGVVTCAATSAAVAPDAAAEPPDPSGDLDAESPERDGDHVDEGPIAIHGPPQLGKGRTFSERIAEQLTLLGDSVNGHVGALSLETIKFRIDGAKRRAHLRLAAGESRYLALEIEGDIHFRRGAAEVDAKVDLMIGGHAVRFELPDFEVMPRSYLGDRYVEVRVPLLRGSF